MSITLSLKRVQRLPGGKELLVDATAVKPGDGIEYQALYTNKGTQALTNVMATLPLPVGVDYQPQTANPVPVQASVDGKTFAAEPLTRTVTGKDGKPVTERIPYAEYRALRWQVALVEPGKSFEVKARGRVSTDQAVSVAATGARPQGSSK